MLRLAANGFSRLNCRPLRGGAGGLNWRNKLEIWKKKNIFEIMNYALSFDIARPKLTRRTSRPIIEGLKIKWQNSGHRSYRHYSLPLQVGVARSS